MSRPRRMSDEDLKEFVLGFVDGRLFSSAHLPDDSLLGMVFMPLSLGALSEWLPPEIEQIGCVWEWMDKAGPRSINGYPMFFSVRIMHKRDWERAHKAILKEEDRRKTVEV